MTVTGDQVFDQCRPMKIILIYFVTNKKIQTKSGKVCSRPVPPAIEDLLAGAVGLMSCCHIAVIFQFLKNFGFDTTLRQVEKLVEIINHTFDGRITE